MYGYPGESGYSSEELPFGDATPGCQYALFDHVYLVGFPPASGLLLLLFGIVG